MPDERGNPGRGGLVLRGADARRPEPAPAGRAARFSEAGLLLGALAVVAFFFVPADNHRPWPVVLLLGAFAIAAQTGTTLRLRRERARVAAIVARRERAARGLRYFG